MAISKIINDGIDNLSITSAGNVIFGGGITFNGDSVNANVLDDYEEGTWTPIYTGSTTNPTVSYTVQYGEYVKIGRQVIARCELRTGSVSGGSGIVNVGGLPFTGNSNNGSRAGSVIIGYSNLFANDNPQAGYQNNNTTSFILGHNSITTDTNSPLAGTLTMLDLDTGSAKNFLMATIIYSVV